MSYDAVAAKAISDLATARETIAALREALTAAAKTLDMAGWPLHAADARAALETSGGIK